MDQDQEEVEERANEIFDEADADGSGEIDFGEWCAATVNKDELLVEENLKLMGRRVRVLRGNTKYNIGVLAPYVGSFTIYDYSVVVSC